MARRQPSKAQIVSNMEANANRKSYLDSDLLDRIERQQDQWNAEAEEQKELAKFTGCPDSTLAEMWRTGETLDGKPLNADDKEALVEAFGRRFNRIPAQALGKSPKSAREPADPGEVKPDRLFRRKEAAELLGMSASTLDRKIDNGDIHAIKTGERIKGVMGAEINRIREAGRSRPKQITRR